MYEQHYPSAGAVGTDTLQYVLHEEGRIRNSIKTNMQTGAVTISLEYDYFLKDHLGNIRTTLTEEQRTDAYPVASLETAALSNEQLYYTNLTNGKINKNTVSGYPTDGYTNPNDFIQKLNSGNKIGATMLLKVMAGDKLTVRANSWYNNTASPQSPVSPLADIVTALTNSIPGVSGEKIIQSQLTSTVLNPSVSGFLNTRDAGGAGTKPKAWFNVVLLDEQLNPVITNDGKNSFFEQASTSGTFKTHSIVDREITKNGYVYIYVSNETPNIDVFFDNLQVTHKRGALLSESAYYPFGLEMKGISSSAATTIVNNYKFNSGTELNDNFDINYYETYYRNYDPQIGRFTGLDVKSEMTFNQTPYNFVSNNPILFTDPFGDSKKQQQYPKYVNGSYWLNGSILSWDQVYDMLNSMGELTDVSNIAGVSITNGNANGGTVRAQVQGFSLGIVKLLYQIQRAFNKTDHKLTASVDMLTVLTTFEAFSPTLYDMDGSSSGNATIGFGTKVHDGPITGDETLTEVNLSEAVVLMTMEIEVIEGHILQQMENRGIDATNISQDQFNALVDLYFNAGTGATGTALNYIANGDYTGAGSYILGNYNEGDFGIRRRRFAEYNMFIGNYLTKQEVESNYYFQ